VGTTEKILIKRIPLKKGGKKVGQTKAILNCAFGKREPEPPA
jgi:hypothetical protein